MALISCRFSDEASGTCPIFVYQKLKRRKITISSISKRKIWFKSIRRIEIIHLYKIILKFIEGSIDRKYQIEPFLFKNVIIFAIKFQ